MPLFSLESGLVVRHGARQLEFLRLIPGGKVQFEDQRTRLVQVMSLPRFYSAVLDGNIVPLIGNESISNTAQPDKSTLITDLSSLDPKDTAAVSRRMKWVKALRKRCITRGQRAKLQVALAGIAEALGETKPPSVSTILGWMRDYELSSCNPAALISGNTRRHRERRLNPLVEEVIHKKIRSVYLTRARFTLRHTVEQINLALCKLVTLKKLAPEEAVVSQSTVVRRINEFSRHDIDKARIGPDYARARYRTTVEGTQAMRAMQQLQCDHTLLNWVVICDRTGLPLGRPTLTVIVDAMSGYVVGIYVSFYGPGLTSVLNVIKNAIRPKDDLAAAAGTKKPWIAFGLGETIVLDNGLEFHSPQFQLAAWELGIDLEYCRVRTPWLKPKVERFFLNLDYLTLTDGRVRKPIENGLNLNPKDHASILFSAFVKGVIKFVVDVYPFEFNERRLQTPFDAFNESIELLPPPVFPSSFEQLNLIAAMSKVLTVGPAGVVMPGLNYSSPVLHQLKMEVGHKFKTRIKWNPDDLSFIYLQHPVEKLWLPIPSIHPTYTDGLSWTQHQLIRKHAIAKHVAGHGPEQLLLARQELHEIWMNPQARINRSQDMRTAGKFSGLSSNQILLPASAPVALSPEKILSRDEIVIPQIDVPDFESFVMGRR
jgi:putative transposase